MAARQEHKGVLHVQQKLQLAATAASLPALRARHLRQVRQKEGSVDAVRVCFCPDFCPDIPRFHTSNVPRESMAALGSASPTEPRLASGGDFPPPRMAHFQVPEALQRGWGFGGDGH
jgi:hypothetical protein